MPFSSKSPHVLLCWEYGAGLGHISKLKLIAGALKVRGWKTTLVNPTGMDCPPNQCIDTMLDLPLAEQLAPDRIESPDAPIASFNHAIWNFGFHSTEFVFTRLLLWRTMFQRVKPDLIIADYAPGALLMAKGKIPCIATGNAYTLPPVNMKRYPRFFDVEEQFDEIAILSAVNRALVMAGKPEIRYLPEIFLADYQAVFTHPILDIYRAVRTPQVSGPMFASAIPKAPTQKSKRLFVYLTHCKAQVFDAVIGCVSELEMPVDIFTLQNERIKPELYGQENINILDHPISLGDMIAEYSLVIHLGGHTLICELLSAGVAQLLLPIDIEKILNCRILERADLALVHRLDRDDEINPDDLITTIVQAANNDDLTIGATKFAETIPIESHTKPFVQFIDACEKLVDRYSK